MWVGVKAFRAKANPAATECDSADFSAIPTSKSKLFVIPQAKDLPNEFGVAETIGRFPSEKLAKDFVKTIGLRVEDCAKNKLTARVDQRSSFKTATYSGKTWRIGLEVTKGKRVYFRMAIVRRGLDVAQVTFTPTGKFDVPPKTFDAVALRAGARLRYVGQ